MMRRALLPTGLTLLLAVVALSAFGVTRRDEADSGARPFGTVPTNTATRPGTTSTRLPIEPPAARTAFASPQQAFAPYEPPAGETYANGKRLAGRVAQRLATFPPEASTRSLSRAVDASGGRRIATDGTLAPLLDPARRSSGEVIYVQLSGVTASTLGAMVLVRQHLEDAAGRRENVVRVMDVRLRRRGGPWSLDRVASVGGAPVPRPSDVSPAAARVLDHSDILLPDTARWDIHRGGVDEGLLRALADAADRWPLAVSVLRTGHPRNVWGKGHPSAHTYGFAADVYAVDGTLVLRQRENGSSAQRLAAAFLAAGAWQVGSPWLLPPGGKRSFTDRVHEDHIHVQQMPIQPG
jgi:hypothetical protein